VFPDKRYHKTYVIVDKIFGTMARIKTNLAYSDPPQALSKYRPPKNKATQDIARLKRFCSTKDVVIKVHGVLYASLGIIVIKGTPIGFRDKIGASLRNLITVFNMLSPMTQTNIALVNGGIFNRIRILRVDRDTIVSIVGTTIYPRSAIY